MLLLLKLNLNLTRMKNEFKTIPKFRFWLKEQGMTQEDLADRTHLAIRTVHKLVNTGIANKSTILLVSMVLELSESDLIDMLITEQNKEHFEKLEK